MRSRSIHQLRAACLEFTLVNLVVLGGLCVAGRAQKKRPQIGSGIDEQGNVYVSSADGRRITMASREDCTEVSQALDYETMGCLVSRGMNDQGFVPQLQVEVYRKGGRKLVLEPGGPIREWRFWNDGRQVEISFMTDSGRVAHSLYDSQTGRVIDTVEDPPDLSQLPQWAKSRTQIEDESVPSGPEFDQERTKWLAKVMGQIAAIKPGMYRKDLATLFRADGGLTFFGQSSRFVYKECPLIKINVEFKRPAEKAPPKWDDPDDVIESISKPYLEYPFAD